MLIFCILDNSYKINSDIERIDAEIKRLKADTAQITILEKEIEKNRKIYVYNMDDVLTKIGLVESKKKFEDDVYKLSEEVASAEEKIKNIKMLKLKMILP
ncbi:MAG: hypothetical protein IJ677_09195 [Alphaproteobacteria bacterium]|nr:hypothetical protein [Alphaproteobacteria bacterium]